MMVFKFWVVILMRSGGWERFVEDGGMCVEIRFVQKVINTCPG
jgi:hypothetical protein